MEIKNVFSRLQAVLSSPVEAGRCEAALAILRRQEAGVQARCGAHFSRQLAAVANRYPRFVSEAPAAASAARDAVALGV